MLCAAALLCTAVLLLGAVDSVQLSAKTGSALTRRGRSYTRQRAESRESAMMKHRLTLRSFSASRHSESSADSSPVKEFVSGGTKVREHNGHFHVSHPRGSRLSAVAKEVPSEQQTKRNEAWKLAEQRSQELFAPPASMQLPKGTVELEIQEKVKVKDKAGVEEQETLELSIPIPASMPPSEAELAKAAFDESIQLDDGAQGVVDLEIQATTHTTNAQQNKLKAVSTDRSKSGRSASPSKVLREQYQKEDCFACRFIWAQVEMDVGDTLMWQEVQESFEHNCIEAQSGAKIFWTACADMYEDIIQIIKDYLVGKYNVEKMCERARFCGEEEVAEETPNTPRITRYIPTPVPPPKKVVPPPPNYRKEFLVKLHFNNGYDKFKLFDFPGEKELFPKAFSDLKQKLADAGDDISKGLIIYVGGYASLRGENFQKNMKLSEDRAKSGACYVSSILEQEKMEDYTINVGYFGDTKNQVGVKNVTAETGDRRVDIFFADNAGLANHMATKFTWRKGDSALSSSCSSWKK